MLRIGGEEEQADLAKLIERKVALLLALVAVQAERLVLVRQLANPVGHLLHRALGVEEDEDLAVLGLDLVDDLDEPCEEASGQRAKALKRTRDLLVALVDVPVAENDLLLDLHQRKDLVSICRKGTKDQTHPLRSDQLVLPDVDPRSVLQELVGEVAHLLRPRRGEPAGSSVVS